MPDLSGAVLEESSRRGFLSRAGKVLLAIAGGGAAAAMAREEEAEGYHFCGHIFTTGSCPHPTGLPRVDARGYPVRARDGRPVDDLGRLIDRQGRPVSEAGRLLRDPDGRTLPRAPRTRLCRATGQRYRIPTQIDGSWFRCCGGQLRKLIDCCTSRSRRINGDAALTGYCHGGRKVFCVHYYDTRIPC
jgi:hypothetical protein